MNSRLTGKEKSLQIMQAFYQILGVTVLSIHIGVFNGIDTVSREYRVCKWL